MRKLIAVALLVLASCSVEHFDQKAKTPKAWAFEGASVDSLIAQLKAGSTVTLRFDAAGAPWLTVDQNGPLDEARPCPPYTGCN